MTLDAIAVYNLLLGVLAGGGLLYLLVLQRDLEYRPFLMAMVAGLLLFVVVDPVIHVLAPHFTHLIHVVAGLFVAFGLYDPVRNDLRRGQWAELVLEDPVAVRDRREWMTPMDDRILELFHSSDLVLTPAIIAYNLEYSRGEVNRRLSELESHGFLERVERGKYRLTDLGVQYLHGDVDRSSN